MSRAQIICVHVVPHLLGALMTMSPSRKGNDAQRALSATTKRPWFEEMLAEPDPRRLLRLHARHTREITARVAPMGRVLHQAAGTDPELAADYQATLRRRYEEQSAITVELARRRALRRGLTATAAADILWTLSGRETYEALVIQRGWTARDYERWLGDSLIAILLTPPR